MSQDRKTETGSHSITLRPSRITDLWYIHRMYDSLSPESKRFFSPGIFGFRSISLYWFLAQGALILSSITLTRRLLRRVYAKASIFMVVAVEVQSHSNRLTGFAYLRGDESPGELSFSICVDDSYQGQGIGSNLMDKLIRWAERDAAKRITLSVHKDNIKAISLYEKYGFQLDSFKMALELGKEGEHLK